MRRPPPPEPGGPIAFWRAQVEVEVEVGGGLSRAPGGERESAATAWPRVQAQAGLAPSQIRRRRLGPQARDVGQGEERRASLLAAHV